MVAVVFQLLEKLAELVETVAAADLGLVEVLPTH